MKIEDYLTLRFNQEDVVQNWVVVFLSRGGGKCAVAARENAKKHTHPLQQVAAFDLTDPRVAATVDDIVEAQNKTAKQNKLKKTIAKAKTGIRTTG